MEMKLFMLTVLKKIKYLSTKAVHLSPQPSALKPWGWLQDYSIYWTHTRFLASFIVLDKCTNAIYKGISIDVPGTSSVNYGKGTDRDQECQFIETFFY